MSSTKERLWSLVRQRDARASRNFEEDGSVLLLFGEDVTLLLREYPLEEFGVYLSWSSSPAHAALEAAQEMVEHLTEAVTLATTMRAIIDHNEEE